MEIEGNMLADTLAKRASSQHATKHYQYTSYSFLKQEVHTSIKNAWSKDWATQQKLEDNGRRSKGLGKFYRAHMKYSIPDLKFKPFNFTKFSRKAQSSYIQVRTGIGNNLTYLKKIGKSETDLCNFCSNSIQTTSHLILHCSKFKRQRQEHFKDLKPLVLKILFNTNVGKTALLRYLSSTGCFYGGKDEEDGN